MLTAWVDTYLRSFSSLTEDFWKPFTIVIRHWSKAQTSPVVQSQVSGTIKFAPLLFELNHLFHHYFQDSLDYVISVADVDFAITYRDSNYHQLAAKEFS